MALAFSRLHNAKCMTKIGNGLKKEQQNQKRLPHLCILRGLDNGTNVTSPLHYPETPPKWNSITNGSLTFAFSEAEKRAEMLCHPRILECLQCKARGAKCEMAV